MKIDGFVHNLTSWESWKLMEGIGGVAGSLAKLSGMVGHSFVLNFPWILTMESPKSKKPTPQYIYIYIYICWETYPEKLIHDFISKINKYMKSWHFTSFLWKEKFFTSKASNNSYIGMFTKLHKLHKLQKSHQNRSQNGITAPHRK